MALPPQYRARTTPAERLPAFPWDSLADAKARAAAHPDGLIDLSIGTPVDEVFDSARAGLASASAVPGYPQTAGTPELRAALTAAMERRHGVTGLSTDRGVLPVVGTKEAIAWLPFLLGAGEGHTVVIPELSYPTYEVGARLAGASVVRADSLTQLGPSRPTLMYVNSPGNPSGRVLGVDHLRKVVAWARERGVIVVSDECYLGLDWDAESPSILDPRVCDGDFTGLLAVHSLSKIANMASYRAGWICGDEELVQGLLALRRHAGLIVPGPVQAAMVSSLDDDHSADVQRARYQRRRAILREAVEGAGFRVDDSDGGLYLWATRDGASDAEATAADAADAADAFAGAGDASTETPTESATEATAGATTETCRDLVDWFAERGILVAPGEFYGPKGVRHVRIGLTASDEAIDLAASRLRA
ncbi:succinyldiaminopimelate transaminase [uncultured Corynebacterium sp.]|uniref:succinyldiaminopimelate transaminase n=1 Tax=uncultured Corynebacterium sp. TaxID=159447 RepID=UPI0025DBF92C|nr:succinyldiaminopimelate transaminase [uncultured Corynebacterium sp.]